MSGPASITVLAMGRSEEQALLDWSRGLDWVRWMLGDVRSQLPTLSTTCDAPYDTRAVLKSWQTFVQEVFTPVLGPALRASWQAAQVGQTQRLMAQARNLEKELPVAIKEPSTTAARILLRSTRGAAFQATLGKHRAAIAEERCPAHLVCVWAAVGALFQLGLANVCAEYLRLEWTMLSRHCPDLAEPEGEFSIATLTSGLLAPCAFACGPGERVETQQQEA